MPETKVEMLDVYKEMRKYGGSFVRALAEAFVYADENNLERLKTAFPEIWGKYKSMATWDAEKAAHDSQLAADKVEGDVGVS